MTYTDRRECMKSWYQAHRDEQRSYKKAWRQAHKEEQKARVKAWKQAHKGEIKAYHRSYNRSYQNSDTNSLGHTKNSIRCKSGKYLFNTLIHTKVEGYEIHHCFGYDDYKKFIYIPKELHLQIHQFLRDNKIDADSDHYSKIEHLIVNYLKLNNRHVLIMNNKEDNHA